MTPHIDPSVSLSFYKINIFSHYGIVPPLPLVLIFSLIVPPLPLVICKHSQFVFNSFLHYSKCNKYSALTGISKYTKECIPYAKYRHEKDLYLNVALSIAALLSLYLMEPL